MRRLKLPMAAGAVVLAATVASGCTTTTTTTTTAHSELSVAANERPGLDATASADVPVATGVDPMLTRQACTAAAISAVDSTRLFHNQMAVIEQAAADDDTAALIAAANLIQRSFVQLAKGLAVLSTKPLSPEVALAFREAARSMTEISSNTYAGSTADINTRLTALTTSVLTACA
jgi:hypothetical protein